LTIAGSDHVRFPEYARALKLRFGSVDGIQWLGQTSEDNVMSLFQRAQIVVLPYTASTGSSSVLYQAATWGRPVVASDLSDIQKLAADNDLQVQFYRNGNTESLCTALRTLIDSKVMRQSQAVHNIRVMQHHRPEETCRKYIQAFNRALEKRCSPTRITLPLTEQELA
jgi:glycosyltransferase involved in cell wall biosynthesis